MIYLIVVNHFIFIYGETYTYKLNFCNEKVWLIGKLG